MGDRIWGTFEPEGSAFAGYGFRFGPKAAEREGRDDVVVEWEPGSDLVGDFSWIAEIPILRASVAVELAEFLPNIRLYKVDFWENPRLSPPTGTRRGKRRIRLPYRGPAFVCPRNFPLVEADLERSTVERLRWNENLNARSGTWGGMQRKEERSAGAGPAGNVCYVIYRVPREPGAGIIISKENHPGSVFFKIPNAGWILCPDEVRLRVLDLGLTNVDFLEYGEFV